jgi:hypothetical protein
MPTYEMNPYLIKYLQEIMTPGKFNLIINSFSTLYEFNFVCGNKVYADISNLEAMLMDVVGRENIDNDTVNDYVYSIVSDFLTSYLKQYYIVVCPETPLSVIIDIVKSVYVLYTIDADLVELIHLQLEDEEHDDLSMKLCSMLEQYTEASSVELYGYITDLNEKFFTDLYAFLSKKLTQTSAELTEDTIDIVFKLTKVDQTFNNTYGVKNILENGYTPATFDMLVTDMYTNIERQSNNVTNVPYEIVCALYLAVDTKADMLTAYHDKVNIEAISFVTESVMQRVIDMQVLDLINKVNNQK